MKSKKFNFNGMYYMSRGDNSDLIEPWIEPKMHDVWLNIHEGSATAFLYETKEDADYGRGVSCIACINVKFKEGDGL